MHYLQVLPNGLVATTRLHSTERRAHVTGG